MAQAGPRLRNLYVVFSQAGGKAGGAATPDFDNLEKAVLVPAEVAAFVVAGNLVEGVVSGAGGGTSTSPSQVQAWGGRVYTQDGDPSTAETTITSWVDYDLTKDKGIADIVDHLLSMDQGHKIAVIYDQRVRGQANSVRRVEIATASTVGAISDDDPTQFSFGYTRSSLNWTKSA